MQLGWARRPAATHGRVLWGVAHGSGLSARHCQPPSLSNQHSLNAQPSPHRSDMGLQLGQHSGRAAAAGTNCSARAAGSGRPVCSTRDGRDTVQRCQTPAGRVLRVRPRRTAVSRATYGCGWAARVGKQLGLWRGPSLRRHSKRAGKRMGGGGNTRAGALRHGCKWADGCGGAQSKAALDLEGAACSAAGHCQRW